MVVSATTGEGMEALLGRMRDVTCRKRVSPHDPEDVGTQQTRFFVVEDLARGGLRCRATRCPYSFNAEVEEFREAERPVYIRVTLFVERESQKGIVIGRGGRTIGAPSASTLACGSRSCSARRCTWTGG